MIKTCFAILLGAAAGMAQYKMEPVSAAPQGAAPEFAAALDTQGYRILNAGGSPVCEIWFRKEAPSGTAAAEDLVLFPSIPHGALVGMMHFPVAGEDRRGQTIKPGLYTLRYSRYPVDGAHQGVAPSRDFLMLTPAAQDKDPAATPEFDPLMDMARKASGTPHPACLEMAPPASDAKLPGFAKHGDKDWILETKVGSLAVGVILIGKTEA